MNNTSDDLCEYNPEEKRAAYAHEQHARAEMVVGANGKWRLCGACAALPEFKKFRSRRKIFRPITKYRVYIAGPITGIRDHNRAAFAEAERELRRLGYEVFNPVAPPARKYPDFDIDAPRSGHLRRDLVELTEVDVVFLLPGYRDTFAELEQELATELEIPVFYKNGGYWKCWRKPLKELF